MKKLIKTIKDEKKILIGIVSIIVAIAIVTCTYVYTDMKDRVIEMNVAGKTVSVEVSKDDSMEKTIIDSTKEYNSKVISTLLEDEIQRKELETKAAKKEIEADEKTDETTNDENVSNIEDTILIDQYIEVIINGKKVDIKDVDKIKHSSINKLEVNIYEKILMTEETPIDFKTEEKQDDNMFKDESKIETEGVKGKTTKTYNYVFKNGKQIENEDLDTETVEPITQVKIVGTKDRPSGYLPPNNGSGGNYSSGGGNGGSGSTGGGAKVYSVTATLNINMWSSIGESGCSSWTEYITRTGNSGRAAYDAAMGAANARGAGLMNSSQYSHCGIQYEAYADFPMN